MNKKRILFFIADLGGGGAERVLVNLVNNLNPVKYDVTVRTIFGEGVNAKILKPHVKYEPMFQFAPVKGYTKIQKLMSPKILHWLMIKGHYDIEIAYMHHVPTRVISGGSTGIPKYAWVHSTHISSNSYRTKSEMLNCYKKFDGVAFVSNKSRSSFQEDYEIELKDSKTVHNVINSKEIIKKAEEPINYLSNDRINLCSVGRLSEEKGYIRLLKILSKLKKENINNWHFYLLGQGEQLKDLKEIAVKEGIADQVSFLGFDSNPYKYVKRMDFFVCSSYEEGYSTAVTESIIVGTPVLTTDCAGMDEILGDSGAGVIVENSDQALYEGLKDLLVHADKLTDMKLRARIRSEYFSTENLIREFESFIGTLDA